MMSILHGIFTSAFSLVYCDKFSYEKPSLSGFFLFLVMYKHAHGFGSMSHFFTLVDLGWQVCNNFVFKLLAINILYVS